MFQRFNACALVAAVAVTLCACASQPPSTDAAPRSLQPKLQAPLFSDLGSYSVPITTGEPLAQRFFDQALTLTYGFNHAEAIRSFREAARLDPECAMCYWGIALALGPNINMPMVDEAVPEAHSAATPVEWNAKDNRLRKREGRGREDHLRGEPRDGAGDRRLQGAAD
jgi:hypothetical protein